MRISRKPLYFSSVPVRLAPRSRMRWLMLSLLGAALALMGAWIGPGLRTELPADQALALTRGATEAPAISSRNDLAIIPRVSVTTGALSALRVLDPPAPGPLLPPANDAPAMQSITLPLRLHVHGTQVGLVLRAEPSVEAARLGLLADGAQLVARGTPLLNGNYTWWPVRTADGDEGWAAGAYLLAEY